VVSRRLGKATFWRERLKSKELRYSLSSPRVAREQED